MKLLTVFSIILFILSIIYYPKESFGITRKEEHMKEMFHFVGEMQEKVAEKDADLIKLSKVKATQTANGLEIPIRDVPEIILEKLVSVKVENEKRQELHDFFEKLEKNYEKKLDNNK